MSRLSPRPFFRHVRPSRRVLRRVCAAALPVALVSACVDDPTGTLSRPAGPWLLVTGSTEIHLNNYGAPVFVQDMNDAGQIVGNTTARAGFEAGFFWEPGGEVGVIAGDIWCEETEFGDCYEISGFATAINDAGVATGSVYVGGGLAVGIPTGPYRWTRNGGNSWGPGGGLAINDAGDVVGEEGVLWTAQNAAIPLEVDVAVRINNARQVTGTSGPRGVFWQNGSMQDMGTLGGASTEPTDMNESGQVVGQSRAGNAAFHAFLWSPGGGMVDLGTLGGASSRANAVNAHGQVVGWAQTASGARHAFLWTPGGGMVDMGALPVVPDPRRGAPNPALSSSEALDINDAGEVTGFSHAGYSIPYAFVWNQVGGFLILGDGYGKVINNHRQVAGGSTHPTDEAFRFSNQGRFWRDIDIRVGPMVDAGGPYRGAPGEPIFFDGGRTTNPDGDALVYAWDFTGDGVPDASGVQVGFAFPAQGSYTVRLFVTDEVGVTRTDDAAATVITGTTGGPRAVITPPPGGQTPFREGSLVPLSSQGSAGQNGEPLLYRWEFGDGTFAQSRFQTTPFNWFKTYADGGTYTARLIVWNAALRSDTATLQMVVQNTAPTAVLYVPAIVYENSNFTVALLNATDSSSTDRRAGFTYAFDCGAGGGYEPYGASASITCRSRVNDTAHIVRARIRDKDGGVRQYTRTLVTRNTRPAVTGATVHTHLLFAGFADAGAQDGPWTWVVRWGDGTQSTGSASSASPSAIVVPHVYAGSGPYTATIQVTDRQLAASALYRLTVTP